jgi:hypothetical protein
MNNFRNEIIEEKIRKFIREFSTVGAAGIGVAGYMLPLGANPEDYNIPLKNNSSDSMKPIDRKKMKKLTGFSLDDFVNKEKKELKADYFSKNSAIKNKLKTKKHIKSGKYTVLEPINKEPIIESRDSIASEFLHSQSSEAIQDTGFYDFDRGQDVHLPKNSRRIADAYAKRMERLIKRFYLKNFDDESLVATTIDDFLKYQPLTDKTGKELRDYINSVLSDEKAQQELSKEVKQIVGSETQAEITGFLRELSSDREAYLKLNNIKFLPLIKVYIESYAEFIKRNKLQNEFYILYGRSEASFLKLLEHDEILSDNFGSKNSSVNFKKILNEKLSKRNIHTKLGAKSPTIDEIFYAIGKKLPMDQYQLVTEISQMAEDLSGESTDVYNLSSLSNLDKITFIAIGKIFIHNIIQKFVHERRLVTAFVGKNYKDIILEGDDEQKLGVITQEMQRLSDAHMVRADRLSSVHDKVTDDMEEKDLEAHAEKRKGINISISQKNFRDRAKKAFEGVDELLELIQTNILVWLDDIIKRRLNAVKNALKEIKVKIDENKKISIKLDLVNKAKNANGKLAAQQKREISSSLENIDDPAVVLDEIADIEKDLNDDYRNNNLTITTKEKEIKLLIAGFSKTKSELQQNIDQINSQFYKELKFKLKKSLYRFYSVISPTTSPEISDISTEEGESIQAEEDENVALGIGELIKQVKTTLIELPSKSAKVDDPKDEIEKIGEYKQQAFDLFRQSNLFDELQLQNIFENINELYDGLKEEESLLKDLEELSKSVDSFSEDLVEYLDTILENYIIQNEQYDEDDFNVEREAEQEYHKTVIEKINNINSLDIQECFKLFTQKNINSLYDLNKFHINGNLVLSDIDVLISDDVVDEYANHLNISDSETIKDLKRTLKYANQNLELHIFRFYLTSQKEIEFLKHFFDICLIKLQAFSFGNEIQIIGSKPEVIESLLTEKNKERYVEQLNNKIEELKLLLGQVDKKNVIEYIEERESRIKELINRAESDREWHDTISKEEGTLSDDLEYLTYGSYTERRKSGEDKSKQDKKTQIVKNIAESPEKITQHSINVLKFSDKNQYFKDFFNSFVRISTENLRSRFGDFQKPEIKSRLSPIDLETINKYENKIAVIKQSISPQVESLVKEYKTTTSGYENEYLGVFDILEQITVSITDALSSVLKSSENILEEGGSGSGRKKLHPKTQSVPEESSDILKLQPIEKHSLPTYQKSNFNLDNLKSDLENLVKLDQNFNFKNLIDDFIKQLNGILECFNEYSLDEIPKKISNLRTKAGSADKTLREARKLFVTFFQLEFQYIEAVLLFFQSFQKEINQIDENINELFKYSFKEFDEIKTKLKYEYQAFLDSFCGDYDNQTKRTLYASYLMSASSSQFTSEAEKKIIEVNKNVVSSYIISVFNKGLLHEITDESKLDSLLEFVELYKFNKNDFLFDCLTDFQDYNDFYLKFLRFFNIKREKSGVEKNIETNRTEFNANFQKIQQIDTRTSILIAQKFSEQFKLFFQNFKSGGQPYATEKKYNALFSLSLDDFRISTRVFSKPEPRAVADAIKKELVSSEKDPLVTMNIREPKVVEHRGSNFNEKVYDIKLKEDIFGRSRLVDKDGKFIFEPVMGSTTVKLASEYGVPEEENHYQYFLKNLDKFFEYVNLYTETEQVRGQTRKKLIELFNPTIVLSAIQDTFFKPILISLQTISSKTTEEAIEDANRKIIDIKNKINIFKSILPQIDIEAKNIIRSLEDINKSPIFFNILLDENRQIKENPAEFINFIDNLISDDKLKESLPTLNQTFGFKMFYYLSEHLTDNLKQKSIFSKINELSIGLENISKFLNVDLQEQELFSGNILAAGNEILDSILDSMCENSSVLENNKLLSIFLKNLKSKPEGRNKLYDNLARRLVVSGITHATSDFEIRYSMLCDKYVDLNQVGKQIHSSQKDTIFLPNFVFNQPYFNNPLNIEKIFNDPNFIEQLQDKIKKFPEPEREKFGKLLIDRITRFVESKNIIGKYGESARLSIDKKRAKEETSGYLLNEFLSIIINCLSITNLNGLETREILLKVFKKFHIKFSDLKYVIFDFLKRRKISEKRDIEKVYKGLTSRLVFTDEEEKVKLNESFLYNLVSSLEENDFISQNLDEVRMAQGIFDLFTNNVESGYLEDKFKSSKLYTISDDGEIILEPFEAAQRILYSKLPASFSTSTGLQTKIDYLDSLDVTRLAKQDPRYLALVQQKNLQIKSEHSAKKVEEKLQELESLGVTFGDSDSKRLLELEGETDLSDEQKAKLSDEQKADLNKKNEEKKSLLKKYKIHREIQFLKERIQYYKHSQKQIHHSMQIWHQLIDVVNYIDEFRSKIELLKSKDEDKRSAEDNELLEEYQDNLELFIRLQDEYNKINPKNKFDPSFIETSDDDFVAKEHFNLMMDASRQYTKIGAPETKTFRFDSETGGSNEADRLVKNELPGLLAYLEILINCITNKKSELKDFNSLKIQFLNNFIALSNAFSDIYEEFSRSFEENDEGEFIKFTYFKDKIKNTILEFTNLKPFEQKISSYVKRRVDKNKQFREYEETRLGVNPEQLVIMKQQLLDCFLMEDFKKSVPNYAILNNIKTEIFNYVNEEIYSILEFDQVNAVSGGTLAEIRFYTNKITEEHTLSRLEYFKFKKNDELSEEEKQEREQYYDLIRKRDLLIRKNRKKIDNLIRYAVRNHKRNLKNIELNKQKRYDPFLRIIPNILIADDKYFTQKSYDFIFLSLYQEGVLSESNIKDKEVTNSQVTKIKKISIPNPNYQYGVSKDKGYNFSDAQTIEIDCENLKNNITKVKTEISEFLVKFAAASAPNVKKISSLVLKDVPASVLFYKDQHDDIIFNETFVTYYRNAILENVFDLLDKSQEAIKKYIEEKNEDIINEFIIKISHAAAVAYFINKPKHDDEEELASTATTWEEMEAQQEKQRKKAENISKEIAKKASEIKSEAFSMLRTEPRYLSLVKIEIDGFKNILSEDEPATSKKVESLKISLKTIMKYCRDMNDEILKKFFDENFAEFKDREKAEDVTLKEDIKEFLKEKIVDYISRMPKPEKEKKEKTPRQPKERKTREQQLKDQQEENENKRQEIQKEIMTYGLSCSEYFEAKRSGAEFKELNAKKTQLDQKFSEISTKISMNFDSDPKIRNGLVTQLNLADSNRQQKAMEIIFKALEPETIVGTPEEETTLEEPKIKKRTTISTSEPVSVLPVPAPVPASEPVPVLSPAKTTKTFTSSDDEKERTFRNAIDALENVTNMNDLNTKKQSLINQINSYFSRNYKNIKKQLALIADLEKKYAEVKKKISP